PAVQEVGISGGEHGCDNKCWIALGSCAVKNISGSNCRGIKNNFDFCLPSRKRRNTYKGSTPARSCSQSVWVWRTSCTHVDIPTDQYDAARQGQLRAFLPLLGATVSIVTIYLSISLPISLVSSLPFLRRIPARVSSGGVGDGSEEKDTTSGGPPAKVSGSNNVASPGL
ncbi:unnamed protein product, partial [Ectocarpus fasciculatus]